MTSDAGLRRLLAALHPGERVFMGGSAAEVIPLTSALATGSAPPLDLTTSFVPGVNQMPAHLAPGTRITNPFPLRTDVAVTHLALPYSAYGDWIAGQVFDTAVVHVSPPAHGRRASLGCAAEFTPLALRQARRIIAVINPAMPDLPDAAQLDLDAVSMAVEVPAPLACYDTGEINPASAAIAGHIAGFIGDGAALQLGLGKVPDALLGELADRRGLRMQSGMISDSIRPLFEAGALDPDWLHMSCVHVGSAAHYDWLRGRRGFAVLGCEVTHSAAVLARARGLIAVNSALEVDLMGRANLEYAGAARVSSIGGARDFAQAARLDPAGISIIGLPAAAQQGRISRIVPALATPASLRAGDVEVVVSEYGAADLRGADAETRANRLIQIAHPDHRGELSRAWEALNGR